MANNKNTLPHTGDSNSSDTRLLWPLQAVLRNTSISRSGWLAGVKDGRYPAPIRLSARRVAWRSADILDLIANLEHAKSNLEQSDNTNCRNKHVMPRGHK